MSTDLKCVHLYIGSQNQSENSVNKVFDSYLIVNKLNK